MKKFTETKKIPTTFYFQRQKYDFFCMTKNKILNNKLIGTKTIFNLIFFIKRKYNT